MCLEASPSLPSPTISSSVDTKGQILITYITGLFLTLSLALSPFPSYNAGYNQAGLGKPMNMTQRDLKSVGSNDKDVVPVHQGDRLADKTKKAGES